MFPRATVVGAVAFAIERKPKAATVVDSVSPTEAAPGLPNCCGYFLLDSEIHSTHNQHFQNRSPTWRLRGKASHPQHEAYAP